MAKRVSSRSKNRERRNNRPGNKLHLVFVIAILIVAVARFSSETVVPIMETTWKSEAKPRLFSLYEAAGLRILSLVIPDFGYAELQFEDLTDTDDGQNHIDTVADHLDTETVEDNIQVGDLLKPLNNPISQEPRIIRPVSKTSPGTVDVIIYHTHTTESFVPSSGRDFTDDLTLTVVRLGEELAEILEKEYGITVVHDKTIHDIPRTPAYNKALPTVTNLVEEYPEAKLVIDLHRDGQIRSLTTTQLNGETIAKVMLVVGKRNNPSWQQNAKASNFLHHNLERIAAGLSRGVREYSVDYNQHVHPGAVLIEVGGNLNSLEETLRTIPYLAKSLSELVNSGL
jgi:stage II sporulation protein P